MVLLVNTSTYDNVKAERDEWKRRYDELVAKLPENTQTRLLETAEPFPTKRNPKARTAYNEIVDSLNNYRIEAEEPDKRPVQQKLDADESLGLLLSDTHFGKLSMMDGKPVFNIEIATARFKTVCDVTKKLYAEYIRTRHKIDTMHIFMVGDIIDGEEIYVGHAWGLEMPITQQLIHATRLIGDELLSWASANFDNVFVHVVGGNHGEVRSGGQQLAFHKSTNFDLVLALMLEAGSRDLKNVYWDIGMDEFHIAEIDRHGKGKWRFMLQHKVNSDRTGSGQVNQKFGLWHERFQWDVFLHGHWHHPSFTEWQGRPIIANGALFGADDTYTAGLGYNGYASQTLFTIPDNRPIAFIWPIQLERTGK